MTNCKLMGSSTNGSTHKQGVENICCVRGVTFMARDKELSMTPQNPKIRIPETELSIKTNTSEGMWLSFLTKDAKIENSLCTQGID